MIDIVRDTFFQETVEGYNRHKYPNKFFEPSLRKKRIRCLLDHIVYEREHTSPEKLIKEITWNWIEKNNLTKLTSFIEDANKESRNEIARRILRLAYPHLESTDFKTRTIELFNEVLEGHKKTFPNNYFSLDKGYERASLIYRHLYENVLNKNPKTDTPLSKEILIEYKLRYLCEKMFNDPIQLHMEFYKTGSGI